MSVFYMNGEEEKGRDVYSGIDEGKSVEERESDALAACQKERDEYLRGWQRAKADLINYKNDEAKRFEGIVKFSNEELIKEFLAVLDSFDLSLAVLNDKTAKGLYLIRSQLENILRRRGLEAIKVSKGDRFDPAVHEAIAEVSAATPSGTVAEEAEKGYLLHGKVIRPARVKLTK